MTEKIARTRLDGLDGSNPLAFLAAIGTLRTLSSIDAGALMGWELRGGAWRPHVQTTAAGSAPELVAVLHERLREKQTHPEFSLGGRAKNLTVTPADFRAFTLEVRDDASADDRDTADFAAAFGCDAIVDNRGSEQRIADTAFRTMSGSGHQHFLGSMQTIIEATGPEHLRKTLFATWRSDDPLEKRSMRWEPSEDRRHAYQWVNPSSDPGRSKRGSMLGANRLAIEALPLFPTAPVGRRLETTGFRARKGRVEWTWPIWEPSAGIDAVRSLVALGDLQQLDSPSATNPNAESHRHEQRDGRAQRERRERLKQMGVVEIFRSTRIAVGYFRNFSPARAV